MKHCKIDDAIKCSKYPNCTHCIYFVDDEDPSTFGNYNKYIKYYIKKEHSILPEIKDVKFNPPATIIFWADNTKTVVKTQEGDDFDPEIGMAMAISKKAYGNKGLYYNHIKKWTDRYYEENADKVSNISKNIANMIMNGLGKGDD